MNRILCDIINKFVLFSLLLHTVSSTSSHSDGTTSTSLSYKSLTELDQYGSLPQINNARLASTLHGTLTIAALSAADTHGTNDIALKSNDGTIVIMSLERKLPGVKIDSQRGKVHIISTQEEEREPEEGVQQQLQQDRNYSKRINAIIGSGLQSDVTYITSLLRKHSIQQVWDRYDSMPDLNRLSCDVGNIMTCFMGYNVNEEIQDGTRGILFDYDNQDDRSSNGLISIGRPLACNILCLGISHNGQQCDMKLVDPGGIVSDHLMAQAIGQGSRKANELLQSKWKCGDDDDNNNLLLPSLEEVKDLCKDILYQTVQEENLLSEKEMENAVIICEELNKFGLRVERIPFEAI